MCHYCKMLAEAGANASAQLHHHLIMKAKADVTIPIPPIASAQDYSSLLQKVPRDWLRKAVMDRAAEIYDEEGWEGLEKWVKETGVGPMHGYEKAYRKD